MNTKLKRPFAVGFALAFYCFVASDWKLDDIPLWWFGAAFGVTVLGSMIFRKKVDLAAFLHGLAFPAAMAFALFAAMGWLLKEEESQRPPV